FDVLFSPMGLKYVVGGGWLVGLLLVVILMLFSRVNAHPHRINDVGSGAKWGTILGGSLGTVLATILGLFVVFKERDYMTHITNLLGGDFGELLDNKNVGYLNAFGSDGVLYMTEHAYDWYMLVINPFQD